MDKYIFDESNGLWYELNGEVYLPILNSPSDEVIARAKAEKLQRSKIRRKYERKTTAQIPDGSAIVSCEFNIDTACVEIRFSDGLMIAIDTVAVENEVADNRFERAELDYLIYNAPAEYAYLILTGDPVKYLKTVTVYKSFDS